MTTVSSPAPATPRHPEGLRIPYTNALGQATHAQLLGLTARPLTAQPLTGLVFTLLSSGDACSLSGTATAHGYELLPVTSQFRREEHQAVRTGLQTWLENPGHRRLLADWSHDFAAQPNQTRALQLIRTHAAVIAHAVGHLAPHSHVALAILDAGFTGTSEELTYLVAAAVDTAPTASPR